MVVHGGVEKREDISRIADAALGVWHANNFLLLVSDSGVVAKNGNFDDTGFGIVIVNQMGQGC